MQWSSESGCAKWPARRPSPSASFWPPRARTLSGCSPLAPKVWRRLSPQPAPPLLATRLKCLTVRTAHTEVSVASHAGALIGRSRKCRISLLHDCEVSHNHAVIELNGSGLCIKDVGSTFGTYLNDKRLSGPKRWSEARKLKPSDSIKVGQTSLLWRPIEMISASVAAMTRLPQQQPSQLCAEVTAQLRARRVPLGEVEERVLRAAVEEQHALQREHESKLHRHVTPVDLPLLCRRLQLLLHVQAQTVRHGCSLRVSLNDSELRALCAHAVSATVSGGSLARSPTCPEYPPVPSTHLGPRAELKCSPIAALPRCNHIPDPNPAGMRDSAAPPTAAQELCKANPECERLCELMRDVKSLRDDCRQLHTEHSSRLSELQQHVHVQLLELMSSQLRRLLNGERVAADEGDALVGLAPDSATPNELAAIQEELEPLRCWTSRCAEVESAFLATREPRQRKRSAR